MRVLEAEMPEHVSVVRELFEEYAASLSIDLCFQGFAEELAGLPGKYAPPQGCLLLLEDGGLMGGCVALRPLGGHDCEMKRLYVRPACRGKGGGRLLAEAVVAAARHIGYQRMRLDTLASMTPAIALYESIGFHRTAPYYHNPSDSAVFLELDLQKTAARAARRP